MDLTQTLIYVVPAVVLTNALVLALYQFLGAIKDKTASTADDKAYGILGKALGFMQSIVGFLGAIKK